jgi:hypothetical protein
VSYFNPQTGYYQDQPGQQQPQQVQATQETTQMPGQQPLAGSGDVRGQDIPHTSPSYTNAPPWQRGDFRGEWDQSAQQGAMRLYQQFSQSDPATAGVVFTHSDLISRYGTRASMPEPIRQEYDRMEQIIQDAIRVNQHRNEQFANQPRPLADTNQPPPQPQPYAPRTDLPQGPRF